MKIYMVSLLHRATINNFECCLNTQNTPSYCHEEQHTNTNYYHTGKHTDVHGESYQYSEISRRMMHPVDMQTTLITKIVNVSILATMYRYC